MSISKYFKFQGHQIEQTKTFLMIPHSSHNKEYFEVMMRNIIYFLCFSAALIANISNGWNGYIGFCISSYKQRVWMQIPIYVNFKVFKFHHQIEQTKTFLMIPHSSHNKEYFWSYDEKYHIFSLFFSSFNRKYLKWMKMDISVFAFKLFKLLHVLCHNSLLFHSVNIALTWGWVFGVSVSLEPVQKWWHSDMWDKLFCLWFIPFFFKIDDIHVLWISKFEYSYCRWGDKTSYLKNVRCSGEPKNMAALTL